MMGVYAVVQTTVMILFLLMARGTIRLKQELPAHSRATAAASGDDKKEEEKEEGEELELVEVNTNSVQKKMMA